MPGSSSSQTELSNATMPTESTDDSTDEHAHAPDLVQSDLSKRELEIVELVAAGLTNQEISAELAISKRTVDNHVSNVLSKTETGNRVALVRWALQSGKVCIDELNCCHLPNHSPKHSPDA
ncbi:MAG: Response regulator containing a CheY-like receiver domain and an HTH DNA-binding domain [Phormidesmis priestleyi Ana]|uniref:Response regulator containing a CheY-like receiver domain and an HTH DNA-binding domain n=1 Tax=Phormidesmis priestleyi Ana TaxID=1666911 RepID=A0A0P7Z0B7_9CYAN|nr:MAG: Response regulator containing a CheY-like receiver domain and an HTH DNA-binding domain [Phormidesmis priestleyi Ana]